MSRLGRLDGFLHFRLILLILKCVLQLHLSQFMFHALSHPDQRVNTVLQIVQDRYKIRVAFPDPVLKINTKPLYQHLELKQFNHRPTYVSVNF